MNTSEMNRELLLASVTVTINDYSDKTYDNEQVGRNLIMGLTCGKHKIAVWVCEGRTCVTVENASHRAWRGVGKPFPTLADAIAYYRTPQIRAMLEVVRIYW